ncbi:RNA-binding protein [Amycolatopsis vastitatis]|uniref:RNA-binding protein n=2 Tax=Amycolatopsis vastitatis TaxID=1905142 RepID=A0A229T4P2_9PSEU|nr:RNA-binding protein [Amycolatopsis vastitatis]
MAAILLALSLFFVVDGQVAAQDPAPPAGGYRFQELPIAYPPGYERLPKRTVREVNPAYTRIRSWISSVGAAIAVNDLTGHGRGDGMCFVDTRTDAVVVTYTPTAPEADRFTPFVLDPAPLPMDAAMAPMGCVPGDFNGDGGMDLLVYYWGRTPVLFLAKAGAPAPAAASYLPRELVANESADGGYHGPRWNTNAVGVGDFAGDGRPALFVGNYFPDSDVLDPHGRNNVQMNTSLSSAGNAGGAHVFRWYAGTAGDQPTATYVPEPNAVPYEASTGWTLAIASADLTGSGRQDVYVANDFGQDFLLHNVSAAGHIRFSVVRGERTPVTPKSFVLGNDSFKGMGIDFADLSRRGRFDMLVSNITTAWGLEESNFVWVNQADSDAAMAKDLGAGTAPFRQEAQEYGLAWSGWSWDVKAADFRNTGDLDVVQTVGFVKGDTDRWAWLQELAMSNDNLLVNPAMWPHVEPGDDIAGHQPLAFYARGDGGKYVDISAPLGLAVPTPTRGIAIADTTGTGALDFAVARQWEAPAFYANQSPGRGAYLDLRLYRPAGGTGGMTATGTPAYGATVRVTTPDGRTRLSQLDGGSGHSGKRDFGVHFGLGAAAGPVEVQVDWRDGAGVQHRQTRPLEPGTHTFLLTDGVQEVRSR